MDIYLWWNDSKEAWDWSELGTERDIKVYIAYDDLIRLKAIEAEKYCFDD